jgi:hypothetical protein
MGRTRTSFLQMSATQRLVWALLGCALVWGAVALALA